MANAEVDLEISADLPEGWETEVDLSELSRAAEAALREEGLSGRVEIDIVFVDDEEIRDLNARYRGLDAPTDVLSFPLREAGEGRGGFIGPPDGVQRLGDIVISLPRAVEQAHEFGHSLRREVGYLLVHGLLHLLGYDHETEAERDVMRAKEEAALGRVGLTR